MTTKRFVQNVDESILLLYNFHQMLRCLEESDQIPKDFDLIDKERSIAVLKSSTSHNDIHVMECMISLIKEDVLEGRSIHCKGLTKCNIKNIHCRTLLVLKSYGVQNLKLYDILIEAAICKILEEQDKNETRAAD